MAYDKNTDSFNEQNYINKYSKPKKELPKSIIFTAVP